MLILVRLALESTENMDLLVTYALNLLYVIMVTGLIALGLGVVFGLLGVMNMAHGEFVMLGAYNAVICQQLQLPFFFAIPMAVLVSAGIGLLIEWSMIKHLYHRPFDTFLATWGIAILIRQVVELIFGKEYQSLNQPIVGMFNLWGATYPTYRVILIMLIALFFGGLWFWSQHSLIATRIKAMVANPDLAKAVGINTTWLSRCVFIFGAGTAGLAGALLSPLVRIEPYIGLDYLLSSFFILIVGGLGTLEGLFLGTTVINSIDVVASAFINTTGGYFLVLITSILFLWLRPHGLYSKRI